MESVKAASDVYSPISGTVLEKNEVLEDEPGKINKSPFGDGQERERKREREREREREKGDVTGKVERKRERDLHTIVTVFFINKFRDELPRSLVVETKQLGNFFS